MRKSRKPRQRLLPNIHPGEILLLEFLNPMGLSQTALAKAIGVQRRYINEIVLGNRAITPDMSARLARHFGMSEGFFLGVQRDYDQMERERAAKSNLKKVDAYILGPKDYEEIPELTDEWFRRGTFHIGGMPVPRGRSKLHKAAKLPKEKRKRA